MSPRSTRTAVDSGLGVLAPENVRTILVVAPNGELAVALRDHVDRAYAIVKDVRPAEMAEGYAACIPWPWMIVGSAVAVPTTVARDLRRHPALMLWLGELPLDVPEHARRFDSFDGLASAVDEALRHSVAGMRLALGVGVELPGGYARSAELQALVASHPHPLHVPLADFRSAARLLAARGIPWRPMRQRDSGAVSLGSTAAGAIR